MAAGEHPAGIVARQSDWPELMRDAGMQPAGSRSFLLDLPAPVSPAVRRYLHRRLATTRDMLGDRLGPDDQATLSRLLDPDAAAGVLQRADLFLLSATTVHTARP